MTDGQNAGGNGFNGKGVCGRYSVEHASSSTILRPPPRRQLLSLPTLPTHEAGEVSCGTTLVPLFLNSNIRFHSLETGFPSTVGALNVHLRAACSA